MTTAAMNVLDTEVTVLLVEDDFDVRTMVRHALDGAGYTVIDCASGERAVEFVRRHAGPIDLVLADSALPGISGIETAQRIRRMRPGLPVLHMSGYPLSAHDTSVMAEGHHFISKPFASGALREKVHAILGRLPFRSEAE